MNCSKLAVSRFMRISWNTVGPMISRVRSELDTNPENRFDNLEKIGIDETSYRKGHKYMTVVVNHDTGKVVWVAPGHELTTLVPDTRIILLFFYSYPLVSGTWNYSRNKKKKTKERKQSETN